MMFRHLTLTIIVLIQCTEQDFIQKNDTFIETTTLKQTVGDKMKKYIKAASSKNETMNRSNRTNKTISSNRSVAMPPMKLLYEFLRCRQLNNNSALYSYNSCPYEYDEDTRTCWEPAMNGTYASMTIQYDYSFQSFYDNANYGIRNCTLQRFCQPNGSWAMSVPVDMQCKICFGNERPLKFNAISIIIETMSLSLSLISLIIAILCMINVKRLHLPRNLLHMNLFLAFILRSIIKLIFIHSIVGGYTRTMIIYRHDKCGNVEILSKSSNIFHIFGCRLLSSLFWYTDAVSQTFIFCEATFLFTSLTSHLFRDRGCTLFVLWGWLSPLVWLTMWVASHIITDILKQRSTCWLEGDNTAYFYYFFYIPYAFYLLVNFGIFLYLVQLIYSKYRSDNVQTTRTANRMRAIHSYKNSNIRFMKQIKHDSMNFLLNCHQHQNHSGNDHRTDDESYDSINHLIKSILILIPLFGLHSLFVMWVFYHTNQGHTIWYYIAVIFKAIFGDLQGFFTSLIYFYFNSEIRSEVLQQIQRTLLSNDAVRRSSAGDTLSTRFSLFHKSSNRRAHRSPNLDHNDKYRHATKSGSSSRVLRIHQICWIKCLACVCPRLFKESNNHRSMDKINVSCNQRLEQAHELQRRLSTEPLNGTNEHLPSIQLNLLSDDDAGGLISTSFIQPSQDMIYNDGLTCDTDIMKNENEHEESLSDDNCVTYNQTSLTSEQASFGLNDVPLEMRNTINSYRVRSKSDGHTLERISPRSSNDSKSLK